MSTPNHSYHIPEGYSTAELLFRSVRFLRRNSIDAVTRNMAKFNASSYSVVFPGRRLVIVTQDPAVVNHVLRENHTNYHKSEFTAGKAARLFGNGLLFSNGGYWLQQRRLIQPGFHAKKLRDLYGIVVRAMDEFLAGLPTGDHIDVYPLMHRMSFNILIRSLFDIDLSDSTSSALSRLFHQLQDFYVKDMNRPLRKLIYPFTAQNRLNRTRSAQMRALVREIIRQRRPKQGQYNDLLDMMLEARYEDNGEPMQEEQLIDELLILLFAGHETTANTLSWLLWLVAGEPAVKEKLAAAARETSGEDCLRDPWFNAVINESMRLRPAAWVTDRVALGDDRHGDLSFPKGTVILSFFYGMHRHKDFWEEADRFYPERFLDESGKVKRMPAYFPFGGGPRMCIGNNFAMAEMCFFLKAFFRHFTVAPSGQTPAMMPLITLRPDKVLLHLRRVE